MSTRHAWGRALPVYAGEVAEVTPDLIAGEPERFESLLFQTLHRGGVFEVVMDRDRLAGKNRAALL